MRVMGAVNLLTSFPQLASALLVAKYAWSPGEEAELRGWPGEVLRSVEEVLRRAPEPILDAVLGSVESSRWFRENYSDLIYYDAYIGKLNPAAAYNYLRGLEDIGIRLYRRIRCLPLSLASTLASLGGGGLRELRSSDIAFIVRLTGPSDEDSPEPPDMEEYACSPSWSVAALRRLEGLLEANESNVGRVTEDLAMAAEEGGERGYAYLRIAFYLGARAALEGIEAVSALPGIIVEVDGLMRIEGGLPAINYSVARVAREAFRKIEEPRLSEIARLAGLQPSDVEWDGSVGAIRTGERLLAVPEALPTIVLSGYQGEVLTFQHDSLEKLAGRLGAEVASWEGDLACVRIQGGRDDGE